MCKWLRVRQEIDFPRPRSPQNGRAPASIARETESDPLVTDKTLLGLITDWKNFLAEGMNGGEAARLKKAKQAGLPACNDKILLLQKTPISPVVIWIKENQDARRNINSFYVPGITPDQPTCDTVPEISRRQRARRENPALFSRGNRPFPCSLLQINGPPSSSWPPAFSCPPWTAAW